MGLGCWAQHSDQQKFVRRGGWTSRRGVEVACYTFVGMGYASLAACVRDLETTGQLVRIKEPVDGHLEVASIMRRVFAAQGPAVMFERVGGTDFPMVGNLFGTLGRARYIFRHGIEGVRDLVAQSRPCGLAKRPWRYLGVPWSAGHALPKKVSTGPVLENQTTLSALPALTSWPEDGGPFITLPQVYSEEPGKSGALNGNLGMYRVQLAGNDFVPDKEVGLHYQIHRGIGVHHRAALDRGEPLPVNIFVGGPPAMTLAAVMPLPEGLE